MDKHIILIFLLLVNSNLFAKTGTISGRVTDINGTPISGARIEVLEFLLNIYNCQFVGPWVESSLDEYRYIGKGDGNSYALWQFFVPVSGKYHISAQWTSGGGRAVDAKYVIYSLQNSTTIQVNQQTFDSANLGAVEFFKDELVTIKLSNLVQDGVVVAEMIRIRPPFVITPPKLTDVNGYYTLSIESGYSYRVNASISGFQEMIKNSYTITPNSITTLDFSLRANPFSVNPTILDFGALKIGESKTLTFTLYNLQPNWWTLKGRILTHSGWVTADPIDFSGDATINVTVNTSNMRDGDYSGTITINTDEGISEVSVKVKVVSESLIYPNPYSISSGKKMTFCGRGLVPNETKIRIYTIGIDLVKTIDKTTEDNKLFWDGTNESNEKVVPGIYFYTFESSKEKFAGRIIVVK